MGRRAAAQKEKLIQDLLPVLDNLERGLSVGSSTSSKQLLEGVVMTLQQFKRILRESGVEAEESLGIAFDPVFHEAIGSRYDPTKPTKSSWKSHSGDTAKAKIIFAPPRSSLTPIRNSD